MSEPAPTPFPPDVNRLAEAIADPLYRVAYGAPPDRFPTSFALFKSTVAKHLAPVLARDEFNFGILKAAHAKLEMKPEESYSLIPGEIEEWICSHNRIKADRERLRQQLAAAGQATGGESPGSRDWRAQDSLRLDVLRKGCTLWKLENGTWELTTERGTFVGPTLETVLDDATRQQEGKRP